MIRLFSKFYHWKPSKRITPVEPSCLPGHGLTEARGPHLQASSPGECLGRPPLCSSGWIVCSESSPGGALRKSSRLSASHSIWKEKEQDRLWNIGCHSYFMVTENLQFVCQVVTWFKNKILLLTAIPQITCGYVKPNTSTNNKEITLENNNMAWQRKTRIPTMSSYFGTNFFLWVWGGRRMDSQFLIYHQILIHVWSELEVLLIKVPCNFVLIRRPVSHCSVTCKGKRMRKGRWRKSSMTYTHWTFGVAEYPAGPEVAWMGWGGISGRCPSLAQPHSTERCVKS